MWRSEGNVLASALILFRHVGWNRWSVLTDSRRLFPAKTSHWPYFFIFKSIPVIPSSVIGNGSAGHPQLLLHAPSLSNKTRPKPTGFCIEMLLLITVLIEANSLSAFL